MSLLIKHFEKVDSTNYTALEILNSSEICEDFAVLADMQLQGRGRLNGRVWESPIGNFYCTYVVNLRNIGIGVESTNSLMFAIMPAIQKFLKNMTKSNCIKIKIPNDILVGDKKLSGVLIEISYPYAIIGIGINLISSPIERAANIQTEFNLLVKPMDLVENLYESLMDGINECYFH